MYLLIYKVNYYKYLKYMKKGYLCAHNFLDVFT